MKLQKNTKEHTKKRNVKLMFGLWRNINWFAVFLTWCNMGITLASRTWISIIGEIFLLPWKPMWILIGIAIWVLFANVIASMSDMSDTRVMVPGVILACAAIVSFLLKGSTTQTIVSIITEVSIGIEMLQTIKNRNELQLVAANAKHTSAKFSDGKKIDVIETEEGRFYN